MDVHRQVIGPRLIDDHVVDVDIATLELTGRRVDEPVLPPVFVGLRVEDDDTDVAGFEPAPASIRHSSCMWPSPKFHPTTIGAEVLALAHVVFFLVVSSQRCTSA
jgi:hypothetical protein